MNISKAKTCELVEELEKREAVQAIQIEPFDTFSLWVNKEAVETAILNGPAVLLLVWD